MMDVSGAPQALAQYWQVGMMLLPILIGQAILYVRSMNGLKTRVDILERDFQHLQKAHTDEISEINHRLSDIGAQLSHVTVMLARLEERIVSVSK